MNSTYATKSLLLFLLLSVASIAQAATVYVTDELETSMRSGETLRHRILRMLPSGTPLTLLSENSESGYSLVRTQRGVEGWVLSRYLTRQPVARVVLEKTNRELENIRQENKRLREELDALKGNSAETAAQNQTLSQERDQLSRELRELRETSANAMQIKNQRDQLQDKVVMQERELEQLRREKQTLEDTSKQDWFLYGGILAFAGIFLGLIIPRISWRRKAGSWDTF